MRRITPAGLLAAALTAACGGNPSGPTPPPPAGPKLSCPVDQSVRTTAGSASVSYPMATATGGSAPVTIVCTPPSGSTFPAGKSTATCVGTDARQQTGTCTFSVTVEVVPVLSATRFVAFGDSITEGKLSSGGLAQNPYPLVLMRQLAARYATQQITVLNEGRGGELTDAGVARLPSVLASDNPQVLLLLEGVNDLAFGDQSKINVVITNLRTMVQQARARSVQVFLGTLLPEIPGGSNTGALPLIVPTNDQIRALAASQGATLVDVYQAFRGSETALIGSDGLHPNEMGYQTIAQTFFDVIRMRLEAPPNTTWTRLFSDTTPGFVRAAAPSTAPRRPEALRADP
jgi:lysophospholipase L1-like esterase